MRCDTAFRAIARRCLEDLQACHRPTCAGTPAGCHDMRIALTRLRAAISFFSPMLVDPERLRLKRELKWLNGRLGATRDLDVAIEQLDAARKRQPDAPAPDRSWEEKCASSHRHLAQALRSDRYRRLIERTSDWVENGPWSTDLHVAKLRARGIAGYSSRRLRSWRAKLLKKSRRLADMGTRKRHQLRLANKRLRYSIEFFAGLFPEKHAAVQATLKHLRKAQASLGELNDAFNGGALAAILERNAVKRRPSSRFIGGKREKYLLHAAGRAYRKMATLQPLGD
jgi:CHAD domain-containing protein